MMKLTPGLPTPYYLIDEQLILNNLMIIKRIKELSGCKVLLAQKAFSSFYFYPLLKTVLDGTASSGLFEARLAYEYFGKEIHVFTPGFKDEEFEEILKYSDHLVFNSNSQLKRFKQRSLAAKKTIGIRINPEVSTQTGSSMYDPCSPTSRMGIKIADIDASLLSGVSGFHLFNAQICRGGRHRVKITGQGSFRVSGYIFYYIVVIFCGHGRGSVGIIQRPHKIVEYTHRSVHLTKCINVIFCDTAKLREI
jgi:carboxynorspermidine decarboxylase